MGPSEFKGLGNMHVKGCNYVVMSLLKLLVVQPAPGSLKVGLWNSQPTSARESHVESG